MSSRLTPPGRRYSNQTIRISDLAVTDSVLRDLSFDNCHIMGPAVLALIDSVTLDSPAFDGTLEGILWEIPEDKTVFGAIGLERCEFYACRFTAIGLAVTPELASKIRESVGPRPDQ